MHVSLRNFLLKSIPYLLSIAGGAVLFWLTVHKITDPEMQDLVNNIAASLLSIPLVFLLYDYSNYLISRSLTKTMTQTTHDQINAVLLNLVVLVRQMLNMRGKITLVGINNMRRMHVGEIANRMRMTQQIMTDLRTCHGQLDNLIYRNSGGAVLSMIQIQSLATLERDLLMLANTHKFHQNKHTSAQYVEKIIRFITDWLDTDAADSANFQELLNNIPRTNSGPTTHTSK